MTNQHLEKAAESCEPPWMPKVGDLVVIIFGTGSPVDGAKHRRFKVMHALPGWRFLLGDGSDVFVDKHITEIQPADRLLQSQPSQCEHRDEDDDGLWVEGSRCKAAATHISCMPFTDAVTCSEHKCRCAKPLQSQPDGEAKDSGWQPSPSAGACRGCSEGGKCLRDWKDCKTCCWCRRDLMPPAGSVNPGDGGEGRVTFAAARAIADSPSHPGETLREKMVELDLSQTALASALGIANSYLCDVVNGRRGISTVTALRLEKHFGVSAEFWLTLQMHYDLATARAAMKKGGKSDV